MHHELLVALVVRGMLTAPWPAAVRSGLTDSARHRPRPATRAAQAAGRFGGAQCVVGALASYYAQRSYRFCFFLARQRPRPVKRAARVSDRFGGARLAAGAVAGCCAQRPYCFGSAQAESRNEGSMSCGSLWRCVACCRRLGRLLCAAAVLFLARHRPRPLTRAARAASRFGGARLADGALAGYSSRRFYWYWLGIGRGPQREQHELLVASAVRGLLPAPWPAAPHSSRTILFWLGTGRGPQREQHKLLVAIAVRGVLTAP